MYKKISEQNDFYYIRFSLHYKYNFSTLFFELTLYLKKWFITKV